MALATRQTPSSMLEVLNADVGAHFAWEQTAPIKQAEEKALSFAYADHDTAQDSFSEISTGDFVTRREQNPAKTADGTFVDAMEVRENTKSKAG